MDNLVQSLPGRSAQAALNIKERVESNLAIMEKLNDVDLPEWVNVKQQHEALYKHYGDPDITNTEWTVDIIWDWTVPIEHRDAISDACPISFSGSSAGPASTVASVTGIEIPTAPATSITPNSETIFSLITSTVLSVGTESTTATPPTATPSSTRNITSEDVYGLIACAQPLPIDAPSPANIFFSLTKDDTLPGESFRNICFQVRSSSLGPYSQYL
jgi:hypothetical protein